MARRQQIVCDCGGRLNRPIPPKCPHCGATIGAIRQNYWPLAVAALVIGSLFAVLVGFVWWLAAR